MNDYLTLVNSLENLDHAFFDDKDYQIINHINRRFTVSFDTALHIIDFYIKNEACQYEVTDAIVKYFSNKGAPYILNYLKEKGKDHVQFIDFITLGIIHTLNKNTRPLDEISPYYDFLVNSGRYNFNTLYEQELAWLLKQVNEHVRKI